MVCSGMEKHTCFFFVGLICTATVSQGLEWSSGLLDGASVQTCQGKNVSLPWSFTTENGENVVNIEWYQQQPGQAESIFAIYAGGQFFTNPRENVEFVPNAGLLLLDVALNDTATYSVHVNSHDPTDSQTTHSQTAHLVVAEAPVILDGQLHVQQMEETVLNITTNEWHVQLSCGTFSSLGQPPVFVEWRIPSGVAYDSIQFVNGAFVFTVPNPVESGRYSCHIPQHLPAALCLSSNDSTLERSAIYLDSVDVRMTLLLARQGEIMKDADNLQQTFGNLTVDQNDISSSIQALTNDFHRFQQSEIGDMLHSPSSCVDVKQYDTVSGVHTLYVSGYLPIRVFCDQDTNGGGWTVFQRRQNGQVDFYRGWRDYQLGFGDAMGEFWMGLEFLNVMTSSKRYELRVDLEDFEGDARYAAYSGFRLSDGKDNYTLYVDSFLGGNAGDSLSHHNGTQFSTLDVDNTVEKANCAVAYHGAWWYTHCHSANLNGDYKHNSSAPLADGISWHTFEGSDTYSLKFVEMKMRPM